MKYLLILIFLISCTKTGSEYRPIVDTNNPNFENDLADCQKLAKAYKDFGYDSAFKAGGAAALGAGAGQLFDSSTNSTLIGAGIGLGVAGVKKVLNDNESRKDIVKRCLAGRGYQVLK